MCVSRRVCLRNPVKPVQQKYSYFNNRMGSSRWSTPKSYQVQLNYRWSGIGTGTPSSITAATRPFVLAFLTCLPLSNSSFLSFSLSSPSFHVLSSCLSYMVGFLSIHTVSLLFPGIYKCFITGIPNLLKHFPNYNTIVAGHNFSEVPENFTFD